MSAEQLKATTGELKLGFTLARYIACACGSVRRFILRPTEKTTPGYYRAIQGYHHELRRGKRTGGNK